MGVTFTVEPTGAALAAEIHGLDLARSLTQEDAKALREALLEHI